MLRALFWKEWRQLRLVRWGGVLLGAVLPIALVAGAELASRGLLPTGKTSGFRPRDIMYEILPAVLGLAVWPLIALMSAVQAFGGDRAAGTEGFLLERPVPRSRLSGARAAASGATLVTVMVATAAFGATLAAVTGSPPAIGWSRWWILAGLGSGIALQAWIGGTFAATLLTSPLAAVLLGAIVGAVPGVLAIEWLAVFPNARYGPVPIGSALWMVLLPALVVAAWSASARGEPAGRGRVKRGLAISTATLAGIPIAFAAITPAALSLDAGRGLHRVDASPGGHAAVVVTSGDSRPEAGWLVGVPGGARLRFLPPGLQSVAWSRGGSQAGVLTWAGPLGSLGAQRIDLVDAHDGATVRSVPIPDDDYCGDFVIVDGRLVAVFYRRDRGTPTGEVWIAQPGATAWTFTGFHRSRSSLRLVGPLDDGRLFVRVIRWSKDRSGAGLAPVYHLFPVDPDAAEVGPESGSGAASDAMWSDRRYGGVSPSGRYAIVAAGRQASGYAVLDLRTDALVPAFLSPTRPCWLEGDRLAWIDRGPRSNTLFVARLGGATKAIRSWGEASVGLFPSPDGTALFVSVLPPDTNPPRPPPDLVVGVPEDAVPMGKVPEEVVYLPSSDRTVDLSPPFSDRPHDLRYTQWAGPKTLARIAKGVVYFEGIDRPGTRRFVIGGPSDARRGEAAASPTRKETKP